MAITEVHMYRTDDGHTFNTRQEACEHEFVQDLIMIIIGDDDVSEPVAEGIADRLVEYYHIVSKNIPKPKDTRLD